MRGLSTVGVIGSGQNAEEKKEAYDADVTYGTNNEFGFDYLRDNMAFSPEARVRELSFAIVDEVDSILIDEAEHPHYFRSAEDHSERYKSVNSVIPKSLRQKWQKTGNHSRSRVTTC